MEENKLLNCTPSPVKDFEFIVQNMADVDHDLSLFDINNKGLDQKFPEDVYVTFPLGQAPYATQLIALLTKAYYIKGIEIIAQKLGGTEALPTDILSIRFLDYGLSTNFEGVETPFKNPCKSHIISRATLVDTDFEWQLMCTSAIKFKIPSKTDIRFKLNVYKVFDGPKYLSDKYSTSNKN